MWHGDVSPGDKKRMRADPPDLLLTTPESLEVQLISDSAEPRTFFGGVQMVIVDEVHALAGDDRGWHLLGVLRRIAAHAGREPQRVGLSATVGNPEELLTWLKPNESPASVLGSTGGGTSTADVQLDYVGSLSNAAAVIARLHTGEKRLCFVDSRACAEALTRSLLANVPVWITHSSLSLDQRHAAEKAFLEAEQGIIVATSVLELGVDVGDLDRVIQIDSPATVASFLQRMGRTVVATVRAELPLAGDHEGVAAPGCGVALPLGERLRGAGRLPAAAVPRAVQQLGDGPDARDPRPARRRCGPPAPRRRVQREYACKVRVQQGEGACAMRT